MVPHAYTHDCIQQEEDTHPLSKKPRQDQPSNATPSANLKTADSSYISTTKSKRKKSKKKSGHASNTNSANSALPSDFFDSGVSKTFHSHGEEVYYESSSESEDEGSKDTGGSSRVQAPPPGLPAG